MGKIAEPWKPFEIQGSIEGNMEKLLVVPDREEPRYEIFDQFTSIGTAWKDQGQWCAEGMIARELLHQIGEQIDEGKRWLRNS